ncbi:MAG: hypothetical protein IKN64_01770 [Desulfovibrio sp.]|nr:hypothetical protein [Desulfovibrio sp.]
MEQKRHKVKIRATQACSLVEGLMAIQAFPALDTEGRGTRRRSLGYNEKTQ